MKKVLYGTSALLVAGLVASAAEAAARAADSGFRGDPGFRTSSRRRPEPGGLHASVP